MMEKNLVDLLRERVAKTPEGLALVHSANGKWESISWRELDRATDQLASALLALGVSAGDRVAILSRSRVEWVLADLAILKAAGVVVPVHADAVLEDMEHVLSDSGATLLFVEDEKQSNAIRRVLDRTAIRHVLVMRGPAQEPDEIAWNKLMDMGQDQQQRFPESLAQRSARLNHRHLASVVYTSGTTGRPKGVMLTHDNFVFEIETLYEVMKGSVGESDVHLLCLPLAHILARIMMMTALQAGYTTAICSGLDSLDRDFSEIRPTFVTVVPAILERMHAQVIREIKAKGRISRWLFQWSRDVERRVQRKSQKHRPLPLTLAAQQRVFQRLVLGPRVRDRLGGRLKFFICGGATLSVEINEFFQSVGVLVLEGYGLTENVGAANVNRPDRCRMGTVGLPIPNVEEKLAPDGEILIRGRNVMQGYYGRPKDTKEVLDVDGWLHTGDIGRFETDGFLRVTDRKKDIIVTAQGKNISPQNIETLLHTSPYIHQAVVLGDGRQYLSALISLDQEQLQRFAEDQGILFDQLTELTYHPKVRQLIASEIESRNRQLAGYEAIRRFYILPEPLSLASGEMTPTYKVRRREVEERYRDLIENMYGDSLNRAVQL